MLLSRVLLDILLNWDILFFFENQDHILNPNPFDLNDSLSIKSSFVAN
jgi:hypothetical protein